jgi:hypothetical protein
MHVVFIIKLLNKFKIILLKKMKIINYD